MTPFLARAAMLTLTLVASVVPALAGPHETVEALATDYDHFLLARDPIQAGQLGDLEALRRWPDDSPKAVASRIATLKGLATRLGALDKVALEGEDAVNRALLRRAIGDALERATFDPERLPFTADDGFYNNPDLVARTSLIRRAVEAEAWLARLAALPDYYAMATANARRGLETGFIQPLVAVDAALATMRAQVATPPEQSSLLLPLSRLPGTLSAADGARWRAEALAIIRDKVKPAQAAFLAFLEREYRPKARASIGARDLPDGERYYAFLVRSYTTTAMTPDQVHDLGLSEVARIHAEMLKVMAEAKFDGSFPAFLAFLRRDPQFYATSREALIEKASTLAKRIDDQLPRWFATLPRLTYGVRPVPTEIEESYTSGRYWPGNPDLGVAGGYMVNTSHLDQRPLFELPALTLHEAVPGHHLQIALAQENKSVHLFRRGDDLTVFVEGWALYTERLGQDMGIYTTPYEHFGRLSFEMWRACRLVVDTGMHWKGWDRDKARAFMLENTALSEKNIDVEIDRYIGWPGQALAYKIGELKIVELRRKAQETLGPKFDIRQFHDALLGAGPLPLDLLTARIDAWIAARR